MKKKPSISFLKRMDHKYDKLLKAGLICKETYFLRKREIKQQLAELDEPPKKRITMQVSGNYKLNKYQ